MKNMKRLYKRHTRALVRDGIKKMSNGEPWIVDGEKVPKFTWKKLPGEFPSLKQFIRELTNKELSDAKIGPLSPKAEKLRGWL